MEDATVFTSAQINDMVATGISIGKGGFGEVFRSIHDNKMVAIKVMNGKNKISDFIKETTIVLESDCEYIIKGFGYCNEDGCRCIVFEYVENNTLEHHLQMQESLTEFYWCERIKVLKGVAEALLHLHGRGIVHGDLKPGNILVDADMIPKLADFGLANLVDEPIGGGSRGYMDTYTAFNMFAALENDVYSFGVLVIEVLSGQPLERIDEHGKKIYLSQWAKNNEPHNILHQNFLALETEPSDIPAALLECIIMAKRCLGMPDDRPDIGEVLATLNACPDPQLFPQWKNIA